MRYIDIPHIRRPVSRIVLGAAGVSFNTGGDVSEVLEAALDCGINTIDTARVYGESEKTIGRWLKTSGRRDDVVIISKCCHPVYGFIPRISEKEAEADLAKSLDALGTDHIDIYLLHRDNPTVPVGRIVDMMNRFHEDGKIGAFGGSNWTAARVREANEYAAAHGLTGFSVTSPHYSLGVQRHDPWGNGCVTATGARRSADREYYRASGIPVIAWSCLCSGVFSGRLRSENWPNLLKMFGINTKWAYGSNDNRERLARCERLAAQKGVSVAQIVIAWMLADPMTVLPVVSASRPERILENAAAADLDLTAAELSYLDLRADTRYIYGNIPFVTKGRSAAADEPVHRLAVRTSMREGGN